MDRCPLVMIEWVDSLQPIARWQYLRNFGEPSVSLCLSVGWLIHDGEDVKALTPNFGHTNDEHSLQISGVIQVPASCVVKITDTKVRDAGLMLGALRRAPLPLGGRGWGRASRRDGRLCRASPAAPAGAEAAPHPASPASGRGVCRRQSA